MLKNNYHTHTYLCKHASGTIKEYLDYAYSLGFNEIAITDHLPYFDERLHNSRMDFSELNNYLNEINSFKNSYQNMKVLSGFECEYFPDLKEYYDELKNKCDILVLGQHAVYDENHIPTMIEKLPLDEAINKYYSYIEEALNTNNFAYLAHPDLFLLERDCFDDKLKNFSRKLLNLVRSKNVIIELNCNGFIRRHSDFKLGYPNYDFWKLVKEEYPDLKIIINADAHHVSNLNSDNVIKAIKFAKDLDLNIIEKLPL